MKTYTIDDIARYAEGEMPAEETRAFEQALQNDNSLQEQLAFYNEVHASLQQHFTPDPQQENLQHTLQDLRKEFFPKAAEPAKVVSMNRVLKYAVSVAAVLIIAVFIWQPWQLNLFEKYAATTMVNPAERGEGTDTLLQQAAVAFNNKAFAEAAVLLEKAVQQDANNSYAFFYYGVALLQTKQPAKARTYFDRLFAGESVFKYEAAFYNALTYLQEDNKKACREWLQKIPADATNYAKAQELLKKL